MAATRLIALHRNKGKNVLQSLSDRTEYAMNPEKTEGGLLVTGYECDPEMVKEEFLLTKRRYDLLSGRWYNNEVIAYQIRQSFKPGEVTPEEANEIGRELALRFTKGNYAFIVATHTDRAHIHNHIIFNSTRLDGRRKFRNFWRSGLALQKVSDLVCLEHGLSVITPKPYGERSKRSEYPNQSTIRDRIMADMEKILGSNPKSFDEFLERFKSSGYEIKTGKHLAVKGNGQKRFIRLDSLKEGFREAELRARISPGGVYSWEAVRPAYKVNLLIDVQEKMREKGIGYAKWATRYNVKQMAKSLLYLRDHQIESLEQLSRIANELSGGQEEILSRIRSCEKRLSEISALRMHITNYLKYREVYRQFSESGFSGSFYESHREQLSKYQAAKKAFDELGEGSIPKRQELEAEFQKTLQEKRELYSEYYPLRDRAREALIVQENIRSLYESSEKAKEKDRSKNKEY